MKLCLLASGSGGNSMYIESHGTALIIDQGLAHRDFITRLESRGCDAGRIKGILVTHEHNDHINGVGITARKLGIPIYTTEGSRRSINNKLNGFEQVMTIESGVQFMIDRIEILPFSVSHDAEDPVQFRISSRGKTLAVATDLGFVSHLVAERLKGCDLVVIESNYDAEMLTNGPYPWEVKKRIESNRGHLSNRNAAEILFNLSGNRKPKAILAHLSEENNRPDIALRTVRELFEKFDRDLGFLIAASQNEPTPVIEL